MKASPVFHMQLEQSSSDHIYARFLIPCTFYSTPRLHPYYSITPPMILPNQPNCVAPSKIFPTYGTAKCANGCKKMFVIASTPLKSTTSPCTRSAFTARYSLECLAVCTLPTSLRTPRASFPTQIDLLPPRPNLTTGLFRVDNYDASSEEVSSLFNEVRFRLYLTFLTPSTDNQGPDIDLLSFPRLHIDVPKCATHLPHPLRTEAVYMWLNCHLNVG